MKPYIAYYRVSTDKQGASGLGLEAQATTVRQFAQSGSLVAEYTEIESGTKSDRPQLQRALRHASAVGAVLLVAKLDRLARNVAFLSTLMESGVEFIACDNPTANRLTIHILAAVAENEAGMISQRTKAALQAKKERGEPLGAQTHKTPRKGVDMSPVSEQSAVMRTKAAQEFYSAIREFAGSLTGTHREIARQLNEKGFRTPRGGLWTHGQVPRLLKSKGV